MKAVIRTSPCPPKIHISDALLEALDSQHVEDARERVKMWIPLMREHQGETDSELRELANDFFNAPPWISDDEHWGKRDYWATPIEMLATNGGDCEDFSIGKYLTLTQWRVPSDKLRITYVRAPRLRQAHRVLAYYEPSWRRSLHF